MSSLARTTFVYISRWANNVTPEADEVIAKVGYPASLMHANCCDRCTAAAEEDAAGDALAVAIQSRFGDLAARGYLLLTELIADVEETHSANDYSESNKYDVAVSRPSSGAVGTYKIGLGPCNTMSVEDAVWWLLYRQEPTSALFTDDEITAVTTFASAWLTNPQDWWAPAPVTVTA